MAHYAKVENGLVTKVIVAEAEFFETFIDSTPGDWIQTSYNTRGGIHYQPNSSTPSEDQTNALRKNYAGVGYTYNQTLDAFIPPKPYASWVLNNTSGTWESPTPYPTDTNDQKYFWNENTLTWDLS
jgi:hypothetical protein